MPDPRPDREPQQGDPYRGATRLLLGTCAVWTALVAAAGLATRNAVLLDASVALWLGTGTLIGVALAQGARSTAPLPGGGAEPPPPPAEASGAEPRGATPSPRERARSRLLEMKGVTVATGVLAIAGVLLVGWSTAPPGRWAVAIALLCLAGAGLAGTSASYLAGADAARFPEAPGLARSARTLVWALLAATAAVALRWAGWERGLRWIHVGLLSIDAFACLDLSMARVPAGDDLRFPTDLHTSFLLGGRTNPLASALDAAERSLGIDLRSTWALAVVRRSAEPILVGLVVLGWLSTSLTVVGVQDEGLRERLGRPASGPPLAPGIHLHWPWPIDRVLLIPVRRVQTVHVGHEGVEEPGPEDVLWARQHAKNEYTLLLGNGRDLISIDATVQFRIADPFAWQYHCRDPAGALRALAYRAVMRTTVDRTLADTLSENVATLAAQMRGMVQREADALGLGIRIVAFTVGGMHPPVPVAVDYQAVVSAELDRTTVAVRARADRNELLPAAQAQALALENDARAAGLEALGRAAGEAWSFRALEPPYREAPDAYRFRRRLETLESVLAGRSFTVLDARIQRDGGELWLMK